MTYFVEILYLSGITSKQTNIQDCHACIFVHIPIPGRRVEEV